jgi:alpha-mannosidase
LNLAVEEIEKVTLVTTGRSHKLDGDKQSSVPLETFSSYMTASQNPSALRALRNSAGTAATLDELRLLTQLDVIRGWQVCERDCDIATLSQEYFITLQPNEKNYLVWEKGRCVRWFYQVFVVPQELRGYPLAGLTLRLALTWWAELAEVFVNGEKVQEGDLFDHSCRLVLRDRVSPGETIAVALRLVSPGHDIGGLMRSRLVYESTYDTIDPGFVADELAVIQSYAANFAQEAVQVELDWSGVGDRARFDQELQQLRDRLMPWSDRIKQHTISLLGHAHLDMAWLWDVEETWRAAERTFRSVLNLQREFPELTFCHTTPALYEWIEQNRPELFAEIQEQVKAGRWEIVGGMWVEPEMNLISGEAIVRHLLYGQRYWQEKFGAICRVEWLPDTFGFNWQLPQFLQQAGVDYFVTQKLRWNDTNKYPHELFDWQAPDGSRVFSLMSSPIGEGIDPIKMTDYAWEWATRTQTQHSLWLFGVGDHGGGPTRDMLHLQKRWAQSPFFPKMQFSSALDYLESCKALEVPTWNDELYLEFHRGCYTTHGDQKQFNQIGQTALYEAELWAAFATIATGAPYPKAELETAWKKVLFNQFHDILPGSSITKVFMDANQEWQAALRIAIAIQRQSRTEIVNKIRLPQPPHPKAKAIIVFNPSNWKRSVKHTVFYSQERNIIDLPGDWQILNLAGEPVPQQSFERDYHEGLSITFVAENIPALGYQCFWACPGFPVLPKLNTIQEPYVLENQYLKVIIEPETGDIANIFDKTHKRSVLSGSSNQLQSFRDEGQYWDAWNIDPAFADHALPAAELLDLIRVEGPQDRLASRIHVKRRVGKSVVFQDYVLEERSPFLKIETSVDWQDRHVLLKTSFSMNLANSSATYEIPCGGIQRVIEPVSDREKAMWEVSAIGWADLSDDSYGVSILSDCKHGYDAESNQLRLTLLRGSEFPDPTADLGQHSFTYAIYPHAGDWRSAKTERKAAELKQPLQVLPCDRPSESGSLPPVASLLDLQSENLMLSSFKQSEADPNTWILRCYECHGANAELNVQSDLGLSIAESVDLLERPDGGTTDIAPWQVRSFIVRSRC